jgi:hypothetical protein
MPWDKKHIQRAKELRSTLIRWLGGKCEQCGATTYLEVDHVEGRDWVARDLDSASRALRYMQEFFAGVKLRCLCKFCNGGHLNYPRSKRRKCRDEEAPPF